MTTEQIQEACYDILSKLEDLSSECDKAKLINEEKVIEDTINELRSIDYV